MNKAIHGAFRRDLDRFVGALTDFPAGNRERAQQLATAWANFDDQLTHHHEGEHTIAWPALQSMGVSRDLLATMDAEHDTMAAALTEAARGHGHTCSLRPRRRREGGTRGDESSCAPSRCSTLTTRRPSSRASTCDNGDAPEIKAMGKKFAKVSPARGGRFFAWMLDGATADQRAAVTDGVPGPVLSRADRSVRTRLPQEHRTGLDAVALARPSP